MMSEPQSELVGKEVFTSDGRRMGTIMAIARSRRVPGRAHAWIDRGIGGRVVPVDQLEVRKGRVVFRNSHSAWIDGVPLYQ
jgi:hypothetical protein